MVRDGNSADGAERWRAAPLTTNAGAQPANSGDKPKLPANDNTRFGRAVEREGAVDGERAVVPEGAGGSGGAVVREGTVVREDEVAAEGVGVPEGAGGREVVRRRDGAVERGAGILEGSLAREEVGIRGQRSRRCRRICSRGRRPWSSWRRAGSTFWCFLLAGLCGRL